MAADKQLQMGLARSRRGLFSRLRDFFRQRPVLDAQAMERVEEALVELDLGVDTALAIAAELQAAAGRGELEGEHGLGEFLREHLRRHIEEAGDRALGLSDTPPTVILVAGVNGTGKTTSIAKLAYLFRQQGKSVVLAASDTYRAAAVEQLTAWSERLGVDIIKQQRGADPAAVAFDAADAAVARGAEILLIDTAGRLHTKKNLMMELEKIKRVVGKRIPGAPHEVILVLDATTGQNALVQARAFKEVIDISGIFLAKLDGTAKGGIVIAIQNEIGIPVKFVGTGETPQDVAPFDPAAFAAALFAEADL